MLAAHALADHGKQSDLIVHLDRFHVAMRQFEGERGFETLEGDRQLLGADEKAEALAVAGGGKREDLDIGAGNGIEIPVAMSA